MMFPLKPRLAWPVLLLLLLVAFPLFKLQSRYNAAAGPQWDKGHMSTFWGWETLPFGCG
jgi:hypothetical protein